MSEKQTPQDSGLTIIPAEEVKPEDVGMLSLRYVDGAAQLVVSGGTVVPDHLPVVNTEGAAVATYFPAAAGRGLVMQGDGNVVLYTKSGEPRQVDGNVAVYKGTALFTTPTYKG